MAARENSIIPLLFSIDSRDSCPYSDQMSMPSSFMRSRTAALLVVIALGCHAPGEKVRQAEELSRQGDYSSAIVLYREHMQERLSLQSRPEWENPYFYLLLIGDVQLGQGQPEAALATYEEAEQMKVEPTLISDRYRAVGRWYQEHGQSQRALEVLSKYRDRDSLLFDAMLDRIAKELTAKEDAEAKKR